MAKLLPKFYSLLKLLATVALFVGFSVDVSGQCPVITSRTYASYEQSYMQGGTISTSSNAVDNSSLTSSTLGVGLGALNLFQATQYLEFRSNGTARTISANTPVTIKLSLPSSVLNVLGSITIQPFNGLVYNPGIGGLGARWQATAAGTPFPASSLLTLLNGSGEIELTITPNVSYQGVWINVGSVLGLGISTNVFGAYINESTPSAACNSNMDVLSGVKGTTTLADLASSTGSVTNPNNAIDNDPTFSTFSLMNTGAQLLGKVYQRIIFSSPSVPGDSIKFVLQDPGGTLLNLSLLTNFTVQPYLKDVAAGSAFLASNSFLTLSLVPGSSNKYQFTIPISSSFDRVEISMEGTANVLKGLRVYDVRRINPKPIISSTSLSNNVLSICPGQTPVLNIANAQASCVVYTWYKDGASLSTTGSSYQLPSNLSVGSHSYKVIATRAGCSEIIESSTINVTVNPLPTAPAGTAPAICSGNTGTFQVTSPNAAYTYRWYAASTGGSPVLTGTSVTTATPLNTNTTYHLEAVITATGCVSATRTAVTITVNPLPTATVTGTIIVCQSATIPPSLTFTAANGTGPYTFTYKINNGTNQTISTTSGNSVSLTVSNAVPGTYTYTLVSVSNTQCSQPQTGTAVVTITPKPASPNLSIQVNN